MLPEQARKGMKVVFGRNRGEKTLGEIVKLNPKMAKVKILEERGQGRGGHVGAMWGVAYSLMEPADDEIKTQPPQRIPLNKPHVKSVKLHAQLPQFCGQVEKKILEAIAAVYFELSPEWLTCDGELSNEQVRVKSAKLHAQLQALFTAYGRRVSKEEIYEWERNETLSEQET